MQLKPTPLAYWLVRIENAIDAAGYSVGEDVEVDYRGDSHTVRFEGTLYEYQAAPSDRFDSVVEIVEIEDPMGVVDDIRPELENVGIEVHGSLGELWRPHGRDHPAGVQLELELGNAGDICAFHEEYRREFNVIAEREWKPGREGE